MKYFPVRRTLKTKFIIREPAATPLYNTIHPPLATIPHHLARLVYRVYLVHLALTSPPTTSQPNAVVKEWIKAGKMQPNPIDQPGSLTLTVNEMLGVEAADKKTV